MVLPSSGKIGIGDIETEYNYGPNQLLYLSADLSAILSKAPGTNIKLTEFYGKTALPPPTVRTQNLATNRLVAVSNVPATVVSVYSDDGNTWVTSATPPTSGTWRSVACSPTGRFVTVSASSANSAYSDDGNIWVTSASLPSSQAWFAIACSPLTGRFVAIVNASTVSAYSDNGTTWFPSPVGLPSASTWTAMACSQTTGRFVALGFGALATSEDGITWTARGTPSGFGFTPRSIACNYAGRFNAMFSTPSYITLYSDDGISWATASPFPTGTDSYAVACDPDSGDFLTGGNSSNYFVFTRNGSDLTSFLATTSSSTIRGGAAIPGIFVFFYAGGNVFRYVPVPGTSITTVSTGLSSAAYGVTASPGAFTAPFITSVTTTGITFIFTLAPGTTSCSVSGAGITTIDGPGPYISVTGLLPNTLYGPFYIRSKNGTVPGKAVSVSSVYTRPSAPTTLTFNTFTTSGFTVNWVAPPGNGTLTYKVIRSGLGGTVIVGTGISGTSFPVTGLASGTQYIIAVYATGPGGQSTGLATIYPTNRPWTLPAAVTNFTVTSSTNTTVSLGWTAATGATGYDITYVDGISKLVSIGVGSSTTISGLSTNSPFTFTITSKNSSGSGGSTSTSGYTKPDSPTLFSGTVATFSSINFSWTPPSGTISSYTLSGTGVPGSPIPITAPATSYNLTGLVGNTLYPTSGTFNLVANNSTSGLGSAAATAGPYTTPPGAPTNLLGSAFSQTGFTISWTAPAGGATSYTITGTGTPTPATQSGLTGTSATFSALTAGNSYSFSVVGINATGTGDPGTITVSTLPPSVTNLTNQSAGRFVAVNNNSSNVTTSEDGLVTWTNRPIISSSAWRAICCSPVTGRFVATMYSSTTTFAYSNDGISWFTTTVPVTAQFWSTITCRADGRFVAMFQQVCAYSDDGIIWTGVASQGSLAGQWASVTSRVSDGRFVAVGNSVAAYSNDGITWFFRSIAAQNWISVACSPVSGRFVAVNRTNSTVAASSDDGLTWTARVMPAAAWGAVTCNSSGLFAAVSQTGTVAASSTDGINWTSRTMSANSLWSGIACSSTGRFVAVSSTVGTAAASSEDGLSWTARTTPLPTIARYVIAVGPATSTTPYVSSKTSTSITLSFAPANGATSYSVSGTGITTTTSVGSTPSITIVSLAANTLYPTSGSFTITAINASGNGGTTTVPATKTLA